MKGFLRRIEASHHFETKLRTRLMCYNAPLNTFLALSGQAQSMALCLVRAPEATMAAAMAARSWIQWLGRGLAGICACPAGARSTGLRPRNPVRSLSAFKRVRMSVLCVVL